MPLRHFGVGPRREIPVEAPHDGAVRAQGVRTEAHGRTAADHGFHDTGAFRVRRQMLPRRFPERDGHAGPDSRVHGGAVRAILHRVLCPRHAEPLLPDPRGDAHIAQEPHENTLLLRKTPRIVGPRRAGECHIAFAHPAPHGIDDFVPAALGVADHAPYQEFPLSGIRHGPGSPVRHDEDRRTAHRSPGHVNGEARGAFCAGPRAQK